MPVLQVRLERPLAYASLHGCWFNKRHNAKPTWWSRTLLTPQNVRCAELMPRASPGRLRQKNAVSEVLEIEDNTRDNCSRDVPMAMHGELLLLALLASFVSWWCAGFIQSFRTSDEDKGGGLPFSEPAVSVLELWKEGQNFRLAQFRWIRLQVSV